MAEDIMLTRQAVRASTSSSGSPGRLLTETQIIHCPMMRQVFALTLPVDTLPADMGGAAGA